MPNAHQKFKSSITVDWTSEANLLVARLEAAPNMFGSRLTRWSVCRADRLSSMMADRLSSKMTDRTDAKQAEVGCAYFETLSSGLKLG